MTTVRDGLGVSEGIVEGKVHLLSWTIPEVVHGRVEEDQIEGEVERFQAARELVREKLGALKAATAGRLGTIESRIFDPQIHMMDD